MTLADIPLPSGLRLIVDVLIETVAAALRGGRRGGAALNRPPTVALALLRRLERIVRYAFLIVATHFDPGQVRKKVPTRVRTAGARRLRRPAFRIFPARRSIFLREHPEPVPAHLTNTTRDPYLTAARRCEALSRALSHPMPLIARMARALPTQLTVFGWFPPKRPPPLERRDFWEELLWGHREAWFQVREFHRRRRDIDTATASPS